MKTTMLGIVAGMAVAGMAAAGPLNDYNLIVAGDWTTGSNTWGRVAVGGNASGNWTDVGTRLDRPASLGTDSLILGGNASNGFNLQAGDARIGGTLSGGLNNNGGGTISQNVAGTAGFVAGLVSEVSAFASDLSAMASNAAFSSSGNAATFDAAGQSGVVVFDIAASELNNNTYANFFLTNASSADAIIINVDAASTSGDVFVNAANFDASSFSGLADRIIWNFENTDSVLVQREMFGSMIALDAQLTNFSNLNGSVAVGSFVQNGEVHGPNSSVELTVIPMPAAGAMAGLGLGCLASRRRR